MSKATFITGLMATTAVAQSAQAISGWKYVGCVEATPGIFGTKTGVSEPFSPAQCQQACGKQKARYAALGDGCHCDLKFSDIAITYNQVDPMMCSVPCMDNEPSGAKCGAQPPPAGKDFAKQVYNLYQRAVDGGNSAGSGAKKEARADGMDMAAPGMDDMNMAAAGDMGMDAEMTPAPNADAAAAAAPTSTTLVTITSCPPDVPDCPAINIKVITQTLPCPDEKTTPTPTPTPVPIFTKYKNVTDDCGCDTTSTQEPAWTIPTPVCPTDCMAETCPPQGCKPCPSGCPSATREAQGCPAYGCGTDLPIITNAASSQTYSVLALVGAGAIALVACIA